jgi:hypothetical protein
MLRRSLLMGLPIVLFAACGVAPEGDSSTPRAQAAVRQGVVMNPWTPLTNAAPSFLDTCLLLTDATVMCHQYSSNQWHRLSPDINGSYVNGTWDTTPIANMPNGNDPVSGCNNCTYQPVFFASSVLANGQVIVIGGEYNGGPAVRTNIGFVYNPVANTWSNQLTENFGSGAVGDAMGLVLANGTYILSNLSNPGANIESFNPAMLSFTTLNPTGKLATTNNEENWAILYDGTVLTVSTTVASTFEIYNPTTNAWTNGPTPVNMGDTAGLGNSIESGPAVLRPDGRLVAFTGNSLGQNAMYDTKTGTWSNTASMDFPLVNAMTTNHFGCKDAPASLLPNGNVLVMASPVDLTATNFNPPSHFYEMTLDTNTLTAVQDSPNAATFVAYQGRMLLLPTGEVLLTAYDQASTQDVMLYSNGGAPQDAWRPVITTAPAKLVPGNTYSISGKLFNGFSEGAAYGDDAQSSTNYPLVRIKNNATGHVFYARTHDHSRMGVEPVGSTETVTTQFDVPAGLEAGPSTLVVVVNGIPSLPRGVNDNEAPDARCKAVTVPAGAACTASASVDDGSFDPDGDSFTCTAAPPSPYGLGPHGVTLTCTDSKGASDSCAGSVSVVDLTAPTFTFVPGAVTVNNCGPVDLKGPAKAVDNCSAVMVTNDAPATFGPGPKVVTWKAVDAAGNVATATQLVTVNDTVAPTITAPSKKTISSCVGANIGVATASDACGAVTITNNAPSKFGLGDTTVTWTATDSSGNAKKATQIVTAVLADDTSCCPTGSHIMIGTSASDQLVGTSGADCILGKGGDDVIDGRDGNDAISGGAGRDTIFAGNGNDRVYGGDGDDTINAAPGDNYIDGGPGTDGCFIDPAHDTALSCNP